MELQPQRQPGEGRYVSSTRPSNRLGLINLRPITSREIRTTIDDFLGNDLIISAILRPTRNIAIVIFNDDNGDNNESEIILNILNNETAAIERGDEERQVFFNSPNLRAFYIRDDVAFYGNTERQLVEEMQLFADSEENNHENVEINLTVSPIPTNRVLITNIQHDDFNADIQQDLGGFRPTDFSRISPTSAVVTFSSTAVAVGARDNLRGRWTMVYLVTDNVRNKLQQKVDNEKLLERQKLAEYEKYLEETGIDVTKDQWERFAGVLKLLVGKFPNLHYQLSSLMQQLLITNIANPYNNPLVQLKLIDVDCIIIYQVLVVFIQDYDDFIKPKKIRIPGYDISAKEHPLYRDFKRKKIIPLILIRALIVEYYENDHRFEDFDELITFMDKFVNEYVICVLNSKILKTLNDEQLFTMMKLLNVSKQIKDFHVFYPTELNNYLSGARNNARELNDVINEPN